MRNRSRRLVWLATALLLSGCATPPQHYPSETAASYVGRSLADLEMHWSTPWDLRSAGKGESAAWLFNQYNWGGCTVTVHSDAKGIVRSVAWTQGCGPKGTGDPPPPEGFGP